MKPLFLALALPLLLAGRASAETEAERRAAAAAELSRRAAGARDPVTARAGADAAFTATETDGDGGDAVDSRGAGPRRRLRLARAGEASRGATGSPPQPEGRPLPGTTGLSRWAVLGGGAALGALQGGLSAGLVGALAGGVLGLGAAWLYTKGQPAAAFGATAGGIIGTFLGGPIGGLIGALVGAAAGWGLGKLFGIGA